MRGPRSSAALDRSASTPDGGARRAQLVRHVGGEIAADLIGPARPDATRGSTSGWTGGRLPVEPFRSLVKLRLRYAGRVIHAHHIHTVVIAGDPCRHRHAAAVRVHDALHDLDKVRVLPG